MRSVVVGCFASLLLVPGAFAQSFTTGACSNADGNGSWWPGSHERVCESRKTTLPLIGGHISVEETNGGIDGIGEDRTDVALEAQVIGQARTHDEAEQLVREVRVETAGRIHAEGPHTGNWSV